MPNTIGNVTQRRYEEIVAEARRLVEQQTRCQFAIGELALEIEPMRPRGGAHPDESEELFSVAEALQAFAEDIGLSYNTVKDLRWVVSRWPAKHRHLQVSYSIHRILAAIADEAERFAAIADPPTDPRTGRRRWTPDQAKRRVGYQVARPTTVQEKVEAIHDLAADEAVATAVTTDFLRRPQVAFQAMGDDTARHVVNKAQVDRSHQAGEAFHRESPMAPAVKRVEHAMEFLDLVGACQRFVATCGRVVPRLRDRRLSEDEQTTVHRNVDRVKATTEWIETAVDTGDVDMDEELARLLRGE